MTFKIFSSWKANTITYIKSSIKFLVADCHVADFIFLYMEFFSALESM